MFSRLVSLVVTAVLVASAGALLSAQSGNAAPSVTGETKSAREIASADNGSLALGTPLRTGATTAGVSLVLHNSYALDYDVAARGPRWVSWHLDFADVGKKERSNSFRPDPLMPDEWQVRPNDYRGSGYDRGHQCPSGDRTADETANAETFLMSNMLPQAPDLNRGAWGKFELYCRYLLRRGNNELYIICGSSGSLGTVGDTGINIPARCWKVAVVLPTGDDDVTRVDAQTRVLAVSMPNGNGPELRDGSFRAFLTSVDQIEAETGLDLLSRVPVEVQKVLEAKVDPMAAGSVGEPEESDN